MIIVCLLCRYTLWAFRFSENELDSSYFNAQSLSGITTVNFRLAKAQTENYQMFALCVYQSNLYMTSDLVCSLDHILGVPG